MWGYPEALRWLYARQALGIKLGLAKVRRLLGILGDPQDSFHSVHVAGTNGKGSVTRMLAEVLLRSGHRVGCTTSPHLVAFTERIEVDGIPITQGQVAEGLHALRPAVEELDAAGEPPTFFEVVTALAFLHFQRSGVAWAVVEAGMGGRLDATNVLDPVLTIITNVGLDHQAHLGGTVAEIAWEKGGIMKPGVPCVTAATGDALLVLKARSHEVRAPMSILGEDYHVVPGRDGLTLLRPNGESHYEVGLPGSHQHRNAAVVVAAVEALRKAGLPVPERAVRDGLRFATNPGRLESFQATARDLDPAQPDRPVTLLLDGAHNPGAADAVRGHLEAEGWAGFDLVAGFCADKDWGPVLASWAPMARHVWAVPVRSARSLDPSWAVRALDGSGVPAEACPDVADALRRAAGSGAQRILVAGSLFLVGEARALLTGAGLEEIRGSQ